MSWQTNRLKEHECRWYQTKWDEMQYCRRCGGLRFYCCLDDWVYCSQDTAEAHGFIAVNETREWDGPLWHYPLSAKPRIMARKGVPAEGEL